LKKIQIEIRYTEDKLYAVKTTRDGSAPHLQLPSSKFTEQNIIKLFEDVILHESLTSTVLLGLFNAPIGNYIQLKMDEKKRKEEEEKKHKEQEAKKKGRRIKK